MNMRRAVRMSRRCKNSQIIIGQQHPPQFVLQNRHLASLIFVKVFFFFLRVLGAEITTQSPIWKFLLETSLSLSSSSFVRLQFPSREALAIETKYPLWCMHTRVSKQENEKRAHCSFSRVRLADNFAANLTIGDSSFWNDMWIKSGDK